MKQLCNRLSTNTFQVISNVTNIKIMKRYFLFYKKNLPNFICIKYMTYQNYHLSKILDFFKHLFHTTSKTIKKIMISLIANAEELQFQLRSPRPQSLTVPASRSRSRSSLSSQAYARRKCLGCHASVKVG